MRTIYEPRGAAAEYAPLALNLYTGCAHGCLYCYNRTTPWYKPEKFNNPVNRLILDDLEVAAAKLRGDPRLILLCFTCDPYPDDSQLTREALLILEHSNLNVTVLTKGGSRALRDFDVLKRNNWSFGTSLSFIDDNSRASWEPAAESVASRIAAMAAANAMGIRTWVSIEPVIYPWEAIKVIEHTRHLGCTYKVGKWNHDIRANQINWKQFSVNLIQSAMVWNVVDRITFKRDLIQASGLPILEGETIREVCKKVPANPQIPLKGKGHTTSQAEESAAVASNSDHQRGVCQDPVQGYHPAYG